MRKELKKGGHSYDPKPWVVFSRKAMKQKGQNKQDKELVGHRGTWWHSYGEVGSANMKAGQRPEWVG